MQRETCLLYGALEIIGARRASIKRCQLLTARLSAQDDAYRTSLRITQQDRLDFTRFDTVSVVLKLMICSSCEL